VYNLVPNAIGIRGEAVGGYSSVVLWLEDGEVRLVEETLFLWVIVALLEPLAQLCDCLLELLWL
jgi:hypothetical protein